MLQTTPKNPIQSAILMMILAMLFIPLMDVVAKWISASIPAGQVTWSRFVFQALFMLPLLLIMPVQCFSSLRNTLIHAARGTALATATLLFFSAIKYLPLADAIAIFFAEPLIVTLLAALFLQEPVGWRRLSAIFIGLCGAMLVIRPNFAQFGWTSALPLGAALSFAVYILLTRSIAQREAPITMQFQAGIFGGIVMTIALLFGHAMAVPVLTFSWPTPLEWLLLAGMGLIAAPAHLVVVYAVRLAPIGVLAPFQYVEIISATLFGYVIFDDLPDALTFLGICIIISSGMYVFYRERQLVT